MAMARRQRVPLILSSLTGLLVRALLLSSTAANAQSTSNRTAVKQVKAPTGTGFVQIFKGEFVVDCETFYPTIWNQWEIIESAAGAPALYGASLPPGRTGPELIRSIMDQAADAGLTVMRAWASTVDQAYALQTAPGVYNEAVFKGLDYALDEARKRNIRVILALVDYWQQGVQMYVDWAGDSTLTADHFYNNTQIMGWYKDWLKTITSRVNTINGRTYSEDPTIMAWDLINEPRCKNCKPKQIAEWIGVMAPYLKQLDPNHLVTTGEDGFYSTTTSRQDANPIYEPNGTPWAQNEGQDFIEDHSSPDIDFAVFHMWPDNWQVVITNAVVNTFHFGPMPISVLLQSPVDESVREDFVRNWVAVHALDATSILKKPVLLEEFGKWANNSMEERNDYFRFAFDESNIFISNGSSLKGIGFWEWFDVGQIAPTSEGGGSGLYGITTNDSTWSIISKEMNGLAANNGVKVDSCKVGAAPNVPQVPDCSDSLVNDLPGTGYEGPKCDVDINECVRGTANCAANATCINTAGGFTCQCWKGFTGNGTSCEPIAALSSLEDQYSTAQIQGPLICDVPYPAVAPGVIEDPIQSNKVNASEGDIAGVGNPGPVKSLVDCLIACESAPGCSIAVYSPETLNCLLKGCPSKYTVACAQTPPPGAPGAIDGPPLPPPSPPPPPAPPCTLAPSDCPTQNATYTSYYSKLRYNSECTQWDGNPGVVVAPAPATGHVRVTVPPVIANNVSMASALAPSSSASPEVSATGPHPTASTAASPATRRLGIQGLIGQVPTASVGRR